MNEHQSLLNDLLASRQFRDAIDAALADHCVYLAGQLRYAARNGEAVKAAHAEGQLYAHDSLVTILEKFVRRSNTPGAR